VPIRSLKLEGQCHQPDVEKPHIMCNHNLNGR